MLEGEALRKQLDKWAAYGTIEPTARDAISYLIDNPKQLDLSDKVRFVCTSHTYIHTYIRVVNRHTQSSPPTDR